MNLAFILTIPVPLWLIVIAFCLASALFTCWLIGPPEPSSDYAHDFVTPLLHLMAWFFWIIVALLTLLIIIIK